MATANSMRHMYQLFESLDLLSRLTSWYCISGLGLDCAIRWWCTAADNSTITEDNINLYISLHESSAVVSHMEEITHAAQTQVPQQ
eukprot:scaffold152301_cov22-Prasinocladus_malaysianus.AAC.1